MRKARVLDFSLFFVAVLLLQSSFAQDSTRWGLPERAKMRIGKAGITEIAYSPDGRRIAVATHEDIWMYDARSGVTLNLLTGHTDSVLTVAFSPGGNYLASGGSDGTVRGWNVRSGTLFETITGHGGAVRSVRFSPDGSTLASAGEDKLIRLWDVWWNANLKRTLVGHSEPVHTVAFSPDGLTIASGSRDGAIMLWDVRTGNKLHTLEGHEEPVRSVAFSPDGLTLASAGGPYSVNPRLSRDGRIKLWDTRTGEPMGTLEGHSHTVGSVAFSPDGDVLASGGGWYDDTVRFWDTRTGEEVRILEGHTEGVDSIAFSPDGVKLATASRGAVRLWDTRTWEQLRTLLHTVGNFAFSPDGKTLAVDGAEAIEIWDAHSGEKLRTLFGLSGRVLAFSPNGTTLAIQSGHHPILLCDVRSGEVLQAFEAHTDYYISTAFSPDGKVFASGWRQHEGNCLLRLWDVSTGDLLRVISIDDDYLEGVAFSPDGRSVFTGGWHSGIHVWDVHTGKLLHTLDGGAAEPSPVTAIAFSPDGTRFASGSSDLTVRVWDVRTREVLHTLTGYGISSGVRGLSFSPDGKILAIGGHGDDTIRLWDVRTGALLWKFEGHTDTIYSIEFASDGNSLASASYDGTILLWDLRLATTWGDIKRIRVVGRTRRFAEPASIAAVVIPAETALLPNYPNPFNPETWIPYQLMHPAEVTLEIYDLNGQTVRTLAVGHQPAGVYRSRERAAYWDGRNEMGETVANGVYYYTLSADNFTATRKMLVRK